MNLMKKFGLFLTTLLCGSVLYAATPKIVPQADGEASVGTSEKRWGEAHFATATVNQLSFEDGSTQITAGMDATYVAASTADKVTSDFVAQATSTLASTEYVSQATMSLASVEYVSQATSAITITGGGDNLGNHIATQTLDMAGFGINNVGEGNFITINASTITAQYIYVTSFTWTVLKSTYVEADWIYPLTYNEVVMGSDLDLNEYNILNCPTIYNSTSALHSRLDNVAIDTTTLKDRLDEVAIATSNITGDNLGNHIATMTLTMNGNSIIGVSSITASTGTFGTIYVSTIIGNSPLKIDAETTFTQTVNMQAVNVTTITGITQIVYENGQTQEGAPKISISKDGVFQADVSSINFTTNMNVTVDGGTATVSSSGSGGAGDNLGNHVATQTLNMSGYDIVNVSISTNALPNSTSDGTCINCNLTVTQKGIITAFASGSGSSASLWVIDFNGKLVPAAVGTEDVYWQIDGNGFLTPKP